LSGQGVGDGDGGGGDGRGKRERRGGVEPMRHGDATLRLALPGHLLREPAGDFTHLVRRSATCFYSLSSRLRDFSCGESWLSLHLESGESA
jgi:hypothetical protein